MSAGVWIEMPTAAEVACAEEAFLARLTGLGLRHCVAAERREGGVRFSLCEPYAMRWTPGWDTMDLCVRAGLASQGREDDLVCEILLAMLASPIPLRFPGYDEVVSAVRMRQFIVQAARRTAMNFDTAQAERPEEDWIYASDTGFTLRPGRALIPALERATQPATADQAFSFSCYRATEYVILLAIAREAQKTNPELLHRLQQQWERQAVMSGRFHDVFLREYGSLDAPLPIKYYIPGDRVWFRNPDNHSSDVAGYEGSWVVYLGGGLFPNFWDRDRPYSMLSKCVEVYHWRHGAYRDAAGNLQMDEAEVARRVEKTLRHPAQCREVVERMFRLRDPRGVYAEGGCMDATREAPRWVCPSTQDIQLPLWRDNRQPGNMALRGTNLVS